MQAFLEEHKRFEDAFQAYERGLAAFKYPYALQLWLPYLTKFVKRFGGKKLERSRDLFEQVRAHGTLERAWHARTRAWHARTRA